MQDFFHQQYQASFLPLIQRLNLEASALCGRWASWLQCFSHQLEYCMLTSTVFCSVSPPIYTSMFSYLVLQPRQFPAAFVPSTQRKAWKMTWKSSLITMFELGELQQPHLPQIVACKNHPTKYCWIWGPWVVAKPSHAKGPMTQLNHWDCCSQDFYTGLWKFKNPQKTTGTLFGTKCVDTPNRSNFGFKKLEPHLFFCFCFAATKIDSFKTASHRSSTCGVAMAANVEGLVLFDSQQLQWKCQAGWCLVRSKRWQFSLVNNE